MKSDYDPVTGQAASDAEPDEWEHFMDQASTTHGWVCVICHALIPMRPLHAKAHVDWHRVANGR